MNAAAAAIAVGAAAQVYGGLANGPMVQISEGLMAAAAYMARKPTDGHHCRPKYLGGAADQKLTEMLTELHQELHRDMRKFLRGFVKTVKGIERSLDYGAGWTGTMIRATFTSEEIEAALDKFYKEFEEKYPDASKDFNDGKDGNDGGRSGGEECDK